MASIKLVRIDVTNVDSEKKRKAMYVLNAEGTDLSTAIKKLVDKYAKKFDEMQNK